MPPVFPRDIQRTVLGIPGIPHGLPLRGCHPLRPAVPGGVRVRHYGMPGSTLHIFPVFRRGIRFALRRFRSPLLTASRLISSPPLTKMLQFRGFPTLTGRTGLPVPEVLFGDPRIKGSLRLHEAYRSLARPSSAPEPSHSPDDYGSPRRRFDRRPALRMIRWSSTSRARARKPVSPPLPRRAYVPSASSSGA